MTKIKTNKTFFKVNIQIAKKIIKIKLIKKLKIKTYFQ